MAGNSVLQVVGSILLSSKELTGWIVLCWCLRFRSRAWWEQSGCWTWLVSQPAGVFWSCGMCSRTQWHKKPIYENVLWLSRLPGLHLQVLLDRCHAATGGPAVIWRLTPQTFGSSLTVWGSDAGCFLGILMAVDQSAFLWFLQVLKLLQAWKLGFKRKCSKRLKTNVSWKTAYN